MSYLAILVGDSGVLCFKLEFPLWAFLYAFGYSDIFLREVSGQIGL